MFSPFLSMRIELFRSLFSTYSCSSRSINPEHNLRSTYSGRILKNITPGVCFWQNPERSGLLSQGIQKCQGCCEVPVDQAQQVYRTLQSEQQRFSRRVCGANGSRELEILQPDSGVLYQKGNLQDCRIVPLSRRLQEIKST